MNIEKKQNLIPGQDYFADYLTALKANWTIKAEVKPTAAAVRLWLILMIQMDGSATRGFPVQNVGVYVSLLIIKAKRLLKCI